MDQTPAARAGSATGIAARPDDSDIVVAAVRRALDAHGRLTTPVAELTSDADLAAAGLSSHATVNVMLAVEDALDIEILPEFLNRATFATIDTIADAARKSSDQ